MTHKIVNQGERPHILKDVETFICCLSEPSLYSLHYLSSYNAKEHPDFDDVIATLDTVREKEGSLYHDQCSYSNLYNVFFIQASVLYLVFIHDSVLFICMYCPGLLQFRTTKRKHVQLLASLITSFLCVSTCSVSRQCEILSSYPN